MFSTLLFLIFRDREIENDTGPTWVSPHNRSPDNPFDEKAWVTDGDRSVPLVHSDVAFFSAAAEIGHYRYEGYVKVNNTMYHKFYLVPPLR